MMDEIIASVPPLTQPVQVFRAMSEDLIGELEFSDDGFVSTTLDETYAEGFREAMAKDKGKPYCVVRMTLPAGTRVCPLSALIGDTGERSEEEMLLGRKHRYKIRDAERRGDGVLIVDAVLQVV